MFKHFLKLRALLVMLVVPAVFAQEPVVTLSSRVTGSLEQPRVMYILPWQQPGQADFDLELGNGLAEEVFAPVDRAEFRRELALREQWMKTGRESTVTTPEQQD